MLLSFFFPKEKGLALRQTLGLSKINVNTLIIKGTNLSSRFYFTLLAHPLLQGTTPNFSHCSPSGLPLMPCVSVGYSQVLLLFGVSDAPLSPYRPRADTTAYRFVRWFIPIHTYFGVHGYLVMQLCYKCCPGVLGYYDFMWRVNKTNIFQPSSSSSQNLICKTYI